MVGGKSEHVPETGIWDGSLRQQIAEADPVIVVCGEHTGAATLTSLPALGAARHHLHQAHGHYALRE